MKTFISYLALLAITGCVTTKTEVNPVPDAIAFEADRSLALRLSPQGQQRLAAAERAALDTATSTVAVAWQVDESELGNVTASQPFRVGRRECRRISHAIQRAGDQLSISATVCRIGGAEWNRVS